MKIVKSKPRRPGTVPSSRDVQKYLTRAVRRLQGVIKAASKDTRTSRKSLRTFIVRALETMDATRAGAQGTTSALQTLPDSTLGWMAASSVGLSAGFYLAGAPRLAIAAGVAPALLMGAAMVLRPVESVAPVKAHR